MIIEQENVELNHSIKCDTFIHLTDKTNYLDNEVSQKELIVNYNKKYIQNEKYNKDNKDDKENTESEDNEENTSDIENEDNKDK